MQFALTVRRRSVVAEHLWRMHLRRVAWGQVRSQAVSSPDGKAPDATDDEPLPRPCPAPADVDPRLVVQSQEPQDVAPNFYEWQEGEHNGRFRWRRHPVLFDLFMENSDAPEFFSAWTVEDKTYQSYYPAIWQVQRWDNDKNDWGDISNRMELPGMD